MTVLKVVVSQSVGAPGNRPFTSRFIVTNSAGFTGPQVVTEFAGRGDGLAIALGKLCGTETYFNRVTTSTYVAEPGNYDPSSFSTTPLFLRGTRGPGASAAIQEGKELTLNFFHEVPTGLPGKLSVRNALFEGEVDSVQGVWQLAEGDASQPVRTAMNEFYSFIGNALGDEWDLCVVTGTPDPYTVTTAKGEVFKKVRYIAPFTLRRVTTTVFAKVGVRKVDNRRGKRGVITRGPR